MNRVEVVIVKVQWVIVVVMVAMLMITIALSTVHLGVLVVEEMLKPPRFLIPVQGLLEVLSYFLLVLIGVELLQTVGGYLGNGAAHVRVVLEAALIAVARKIIAEEPKDVSSLTLFAIAALILSLGVAFYSERRASGEHAG